MRCRASGRRINVCPQRFNSKQIVPLSFFKLTHTIGAYSSRELAHPGRSTLRVWARIIVSWLIGKATFYIGIGLALMRNMTRFSETSS